MNIMATFDLLVHFRLVKIQMAKKPSAMLKFTQKIISLVFNL